jgi:hypothetical protein
VIDQSVKEKRELSTAVRLACVRPPSVDSCFEASSSPQTGFGSFAEFPFPRRRTSASVCAAHDLTLACSPVCRALTACPTFPKIPSRLAVRTDFPMSKYCSHGILLRFSLLCVDEIQCIEHCIASSPNRIFATTTKICTRSLDRTTARAVRLPLESHAVLRAVDSLFNVCQ